MGYWLNSSNGIRCATCGREVHESKCYAKKGFITVDLNLAERGINDYYIRTDVPSCTIEFCSLPCLQNADWKKLYGDFIEFEDTHMVKGYYAKHGTACSGLEKTLLEQDPLDIPKPFFEPKPKVETIDIEVAPERKFEPKPEPVVEPKPEIVVEPKVIPKCGMCNCDWEEGHDKSEKHLKLRAKHDSKMKDFRLGGGVLNNTIAEVFVKEAKAEAKLEEYKDTSMFQNIDMAYCVIEMFDFGSVDRRTYRNAVKYILEQVKEKYGIEDYRFRELFALSHGRTDWEGTFDVRALCHAIALECPHTKQEDCEKSRTPLEENGEQACERNKELNYKRGKCSHCRHLEGIKEKWKSK